MDVAAFFERPREWERWVLAAYWRLLGSSQKQAGAAIGRSERTIRNWEADTATWTRATETARQRWLGEVTALARRQLLRGLMNADADLALKVIERLDSDLAPASLRLRHEGHVSLSTSAEWQELRTVILRALAAYPEARARVVAALTQDAEEEAHDGRNGTPR